MFYVISEDTFMIGWGRSENKTNICIIECDNSEDAESVKNYAESRDDQTNVYISKEYPSSLEDDESVLISNLNAWIDTAKRKGF